MHASRSDCQSNAICPINISPWNQDEFLSKQRLNDFYSRAKDASTISLVTWTASRYGQRSPARAAANSRLRVILLPLS